MLISKKIMMRARAARATLFSANAMKRGMKIRFFTVSGKISEIKPIRSVSNLVFEEELANEIDIDKFVDKLNSYIRGK